MIGRYNRTEFLMSKVVTIMPNNIDSIQRFLLEQQVRGEVVQLNDSFQVIMQQHNYPDFMRKLLGEALLAAVLMTNTIKFKGQLTIQFQGNGPLKTLVAKCDHQNHIRGYANWDRDANAEAVISDLGSGQLVVTIDPFDKVSPYQSIVPLDQHSIATALEHYFAQSEQLPTRFWCVVGDERAAGMMLQLMPGDAEGLPDAKSREDFWQHATALGETIKDDELLTLDNETLLHRLYHQEEVRLFDFESVTFKCNCSVERMQNAIKTLGESQAKEILQTSKDIVVNCEYCNNNYAFDQAAVADIFNDSAE